MSSICPECGSGSIKRARRAGIAAGRMRYPAFRAMLVLNATDEAEMCRAAAPGAPDRRCGSCGASFSQSPASCPGCGSSRLVAVVYRRGGWGADDEGDDEAAREAAARARGERHLECGEGDEEVAAEIRRLLGSGQKIAAVWSALQARLGFVSLPHSGIVNRPTAACAECARRFRPDPVRCPKCGSEEIARIMYGLPARMPEERDMVVLGGCGVSPRMPSMACLACRRQFGRVGEGVLGGRGRGGSRRAL
ncbi:MAG: hypothetical protein OXU86_01005 [Thaumarchaeota archaeon]|nr:hypothetical protein [Nitrososphaerota archaeon]